jgi:hypothetical protein
LAWTVLNSSVYRFVHENQVDTRVEWIAEEEDRLASSPAAFRRP